MGMLQLVASEKKSKTLETIAQEANENKESAAYQDALNKDLDTIVIRKPPFEGSRFTLRERFDYIGENISKAETLVDRIKKAQQFLPFQQGDFYLEKIAEVVRQGQEILKNEGAFSSPNDKESYDKFFVLTQMPAAQLHRIEKNFLAELERSCNTYFQPLLNTARSDVKRYLIKHFNTSNSDIEKAQTIIAEKNAIEVPISFSFRTTVFGVGVKRERKGVLGEASARDIKIYLEDSFFLDDGTLDEAALLQTIIHEIVHTVSYWKKSVGLENDTFFNESVPQSGRVVENVKSPDEYLNELITEFVASDILSKYFDTSKKSFISLKKPNEQMTVGYGDLLNDFLDFKNTHPGEVERFIDIAVGAMLRGEFGDLKIFFKNNQEIYARLKKILDNFVKDQHVSGKVSAA